MTEPLTGYFKLRQKSSWEAADSGILLWRSNFVFFILLMILPFIAVAVSLRLSLLLYDPMAGRTWSYIIIWWLKPLFARPVLHVISVRFFEPQATLGRIMKGFGKSLFTALAGDLLWRRFSIWRSARMPVRTLEHLSGKAGRKRIKILETGGLSFGGSLTTITIAIFLSVLIGEALSALLVLEMMQTIPLSSLLQYTDTIELIAFVAVCINFILIEPLYVCMGFGIYINSRIEVEGWDIQLLLQNFAAQKKQKTAPRIMQSSGILKTIILILTGLFLMLSPLQSVQAEQNKTESSETIPADAVPTDVLKQILSSPDFGGEQAGWGIRPKNPKEPQAPPEINFKWLEKIKEFFGFVLFTILVLAAAAGIGYIMSRLYKSKKAGGLGEKEKKWKTSFVTAQNAALLDPEELLADALLLHKQGMIREAWAKCFLGAIAIYSGQAGLEFPVDATEYDCLSTVKKAKARGAEDFSRLVLWWTNLAYGGKMPDNGNFEKATEFCSSLNSFLNQPAESRERELSHA